MTAYNWGEPKRYDDPSWREAGKVWVEVSPGRKRLVDLNKPRPTPPARSDFPCPMIIRDTFDTPVQSMADGQYYDTKAGLYGTYKADGNPQGVDYECIGEKPVEAYTRPTPTKEQEAEKDAAIARALDESGY